jgi:DNA-binding MarR family transcriptional regulator
MLTEALAHIKPSREYREMEVLAEIARHDRVSQRSLARVAGVSATMVNAYVDDLVARGLLEVTGETNRTYRYHLTPAGEARRDEIFFQVSREVFQLYGRLREEMRRRLQERSGSNAPVDLELALQIETLTQASA